MALVVGICEPPKQPAFEIASPWCPLFGVFKQGQPILLLLLGGKGQSPQGLAINLFGAVGLPDLGRQIGNGQSALHRDLGDTKGIGNVLNASALLQQALEGLELVHVVHRKAGNVLNERGLNRRRVIALCHDSAGNGFDLNSFTLQCLWRQEAPLARDDLVALTVLANQQGLKNATLSDGWHQIAKV